MPTFKAPVYSKKTNPNNGMLEPSYVFNIIFGDSDLKLTYTEEENSSPVSLQTLQKCILSSVDWWNIFVSDFLKASSKHFSKPYTIENINKIAKHTLSGNSEYVEAPYLVTFTPSNIQIYQGNFIVNWTFEVEPIIISIPDFEENSNTIIDSIGCINDCLPDEREKDKENLQEYDFDEIPSNKEITDNDLKVSNPSRYYDKRLVKETRLKAKLAIYKAERMISKYYEKYGENISDIDSDTESDSDSQTEIDSDSESFYENQTMRS